jgi:hypothetical protein
LEGDFSFDENELERHRVNDKDRSLQPELLWIPHVLTLCLYEKRWEDEGSVWDGFSISCGIAVCLCELGDIAVPFFLCFFLLFYYSYVHTMLGSF